MERSKEILNSGTRKYTDIEVKEIRDWVSDLVLIEIQDIENQVDVNCNQLTINTKNVA
ncbi:hypothetical protein [Algoriphagus halophilus]|uniref:Uncharacterized protein n=1 Tax=Algoriphagus halophilus TaxID=226505 RepID=A0A1N6D687_9BACT|nr:hypothetical protein [Algoriphagus halophilus]SIN66269.1 hypothetical protein SAMN05444394_0309 [Algoriphagus halophilus]